ncbi:MAG: FMN-binding protein [Mariniphaga sp.]|nr:FMN-binding protein [Mariniphaga sp.]
MKNFIIIVFLLSSGLSVGQNFPDDLPRPVMRELNTRFGKEEIVLIEKKMENQALSHDKFYLIQSKNKAQTNGYLHYGRVKTCRAGGCSMSGNKTADEFDSEYFDYFIIYNAGFGVETVKVYNYQASYGHEISARGWLKQFEGFKGNHILEVGKNIDAISGATISVNAITDDVQWKTKLLQQAMK